MHDGMLIMSMYACAHGAKPLADENHKPSPITLARNTVQYRAKLCTRTHDVVSRPHQLLQISMYAISTAVTCNKRMRVILYEYSMS